MALVLWRKWHPKVNGKPMFPGWKIRRAFQTHQADPLPAGDTVDVVVLAEKPVLKGGKPATWSIKGVFPFPRAALADTARCDEVVTKALFEAMAKGPQS